MQSEQIENIEPSLANKPLIKLIEDAGYIIDQEIIDKIVHEVVLKLLHFMILKDRENKSRFKNRRKDHISLRLRVQIFKRDKYKCVICGRGKNESILHIDHIIPVSKGGGNDYYNLQTLCGDCNQGKSNQILIEETQK